MARTISLLNMKGGVGKTTLAVNLAWHLYHSDQANVLLVDLDPQFNATQYVMDFAAFAKHRKEKGTIADLLLDQPQLTLTKKKQLDKNPKKALYTIRSNKNCRFDLLPAELDLAWVVKNPAQMDFRLEKVLAKIRDGYDYIFIDCAPTDSVLTTMALNASNYILVPVRPDRFSILGFTNLMTTIDIFRNNCPNPNEVSVLGMIYTQVQGSSEVEKQCIYDIRREAAKRGEYVFQAQFKNSNSFARSIKDQTPIFQTQYARDDAKSLTAKVGKEFKLRIDQLEKPAKKV